MWNSGGKVVKLFLVWYEVVPSEPEASVVLAKNEEQARELINKEFEKNSACPFSEIPKIEDIEEIKSNKSKIIYTGEHCC